jgi:ketosteroid isomerase-like protein
MNREILRAMSEENVEVMRALFERFNRTGYQPEELWHPDGVLVNFRESPIPGPYEGHEGLRRWREDLFEVVNEGRFDVESLTDADNAGAVVAKVRLRGRARHTDIEVDVPFSITAWLRAGRISRTESFTDHDEALEAAGLNS